MKSSAPVLFYMPGTCAFGSIVALEWLGRPFRLCRIEPADLQSMDDFTHVEQLMSKKGWPPGEHPTIADAYFYGVARAAKTFVNFEKDFPKIADFFFRFKSDSGIQFAQAIEDELPVTTGRGYQGHVGLSFFGNSSSDLKSPELF